MLDQLSDTDSVLDTKLSAKPVNVEASIRHIPQDDLEAYAKGRLASARLSFCQTHLESCEACRAELEDIRTFQAELSSFSPPQAHRAEPVRSKRRGNNLALPLTASVATILVVAVGAALWWKHGSLRSSKTSPASAVVAVAQSPAIPVTPATLVTPPTPTKPVTSAVSAAPAKLGTSAILAKPTKLATSAIPAAPAKLATSAIPAAPAKLATSAIPAAPAKLATSAIPAAPARPLVPAVAGIQTRDTHLAEELTALPDDLRLAVSAAIQHGQVQIPADVRRLRDRAPAVAARLDGNTGFALLGPFGEATAETRPEFSWQPLAEAIGYTVVIVDTGLHPVEHSPALRATVWRPHRPLPRGRTYLWQVTATLRGGSKVVASSPTPSDAALPIIPLKLADEIAHFQQSHEEAHLVLGILYAQAGMLTAGVDELKKVPPGDLSYNTARTLLRSLPSISR